MAWLNANYGDTKDEIKPQVDKYTIDGKDIIVLAEGRLVKLGLCHRSSQFCYEQFVHEPNFGTNRIVEQ